MRAGSNRLYITLHVRMDFMRWASIGMVSPRMVHSSYFDGHVPRGVNVQHRHLGFVAHPETVAGTQFERFAHLPRLCNTLTPHSIAPVIIRPIIVTTTTKKETAAT